MELLRVVASVCFNDSSFWRRLEYDLWIMLLCVFNSPYVD